ncbi:Transposon Tf2-9 poly [Paramuricea clavata]|uniref:Transposon Tf2-9 poly n=1 Tax=Paramuricea clavata TaxID=317549 RepID=A0A7D9IFN5_PARCT|nr:Transposon Tf2-9 poly [Paramuricea clavata]
MYLLGAPKFKLATDHKPLLPLLNNPKAKIPPRIERIIIKMQNLDFDAIHIPGKNNMTDYLSRHSFPETGKDHIEKHVNAVIQADHAIVWSKIKKATAEDKELCELTGTIETGNWSKAKQFLKPYYEVRDEFFVPANMTELPDRPWDVVEADFCGPLPNHKYALVLTTYRPIFTVSRSGDGNIYIHNTSDKEIEEDFFYPWNTSMGFHHKRVTPIHPKAQGQVENFNKLINKTTKIRECNI